MGDFRWMGIEQPCDLERDFAIRILYDGASAPRAEYQVQSSAAADLGDRNSQHQFSKSNSRRIHETTASTPSRALRFVKTKGLFPRINRASRSMTDRSAPTKGARSVLLITNKSERV